MDALTRDEPHPDTPAAAVKQRRRAALAIIGLAAIALLSSFSIWQGRERRGLLALDPAARLPLYQQTLASFTALCGSDIPEGLGERCQDQATFLRNFPECGEECRVATARFARTATR